MAVKSKKSTAVVLAAPVASIPADHGVSVSPLSLESMVDIGRANIAAVTKANLALSQGLQAIGQELVLYAASSLETASQTATALLGARTLDEVLRLNNDLASRTLETLAERTAKLSEMGAALASEALAPLGGRVEATFTRLLGTA
jgi:hypothetical protein